MRGHQEEVARTAQLAKQLPAVREECDVWRETAETLDRRHQVVYRGLVAEFNALPFMGTDTQQFPVLVGVDDVKDEIIAAKTPANDTPP